MSDFFRYDFGYPWVFIYGHLTAGVLFGLLFAVAEWRHWSRWMLVVAAAFSVWGLAGFVLFASQFNVPMVMPTARFLPSGDGTVVDLGAGSGRTTIMVLQSRAQAKVTALDIYSGYFGIDDNTPDRLRKNAAAAGAADRVDVTVSDMRHMPFESGSFDAAVSGFAVDHLPNAGITEAIAETARILRPNGQFLLMILNVDGWVRVFLPSLHGHGYFGHAPSADRWKSRLVEGGFEVVEQGTQPGTQYFLGVKKS